MDVKKRNEGPSGPRVDARARPEYSRIATRDRSLPNHPSAILRSHGGRRPSAECIGTSPLPNQRLAGGERYGSYAQTVISPVEPSTGGGTNSTTIFGRAAVAKNHGLTGGLRVFGCHCWLAQQCGFLHSPCELNHLNQPPTFRGSAADFRQSV